MKESLQQLLRDTKLAYEKSDIRNSGELYYSIASTALKENAILLVGFNWGAGKNEKYEPQTLDELRKSFSEIKDELGSFKRVYSKLEKELSPENLDDVLQINFCFFRSKEEKDITKKDLDLSAPLFDRLITILKPKFILGFSKKLYDYLLETGKLIKENKSNDSKIEAREIKNRFFHLSEGNIPICFLPHPNARVKGEPKAETWKSCLDKLKAEIQ